MTSDLVKSDIPSEVVEKTPERVKWENTLKELDREISIDEVIEILGSTVKHDDENKAITFLTMLLTYTDSDQINLGFLAESSTGKSYIPLELAQYFPQEDVKKLGYASPTAFFHEQGEWVVDQDDRRDVKAEEKHKVKIVDLKQKVLLFLDQPHDQLLQRLRSLLSHDDKEIRFEITDKTEKFGIKTKKVIIQGFPTVIFCSAKFGMQDQEKTRLLLLSPEISQEKLRESILLRIAKECDREEFKRRMLQDAKRNLLASRVDAIRDSHIKHVKIPDDLKSEIYQQFMEDHPNLTPRNQRDISRLLAIVKGHALLNFMHRKKEGEDTILANFLDVEVGFRLYYTISKANELGLSPEIYNVFQKIKPRIGALGISYLEFQQAYYREFHKPLGYDSAKTILKTIAGIGQLSETVDPQDKRIARYVVVEPEIYGAQGGGKTENQEESPPGETPYCFAKLERLSHTQGICSQCGSKGSLDYVATTHSDEKRYFCGACGRKLEDEIHSHKKELIEKCSTKS
jgi:ribosomal protein S27AE